KCLLCRSCVAVWQTGAGLPCPGRAPSVRPHGEARMANLGQKGGVYHARFRLRGREYKKSLKTRDESAARAACHLIELTLHRLHTGQLRLPGDVDPGDFVVSGGTLTRPAEPGPPPDPAPPLPSTRALIDGYTAAQKNLLAPSYHYSQAMHLRHLLRHLGARAD